MVSRPKTTRCATTAGDAASGEDVNAGECAYGKRHDDSEETARLRFIVLLASETELQARTFKTFVSDAPGGYWHWAGQSWLLVFKKGTQTVASIRDALTKTHPGVWTLVLMIDGRTTWAGFGPTKGRNMFRWIRETWKQVESEKEDSH